jgi:predicted deacylase
MLERRHELVSATPGTRRELQSLHYGTPGTGPKALVQASLHADEVPGLLVAHHLRARLAALESAGRIRGEVVLVPYANPVGLGQWVLASHEGRFDLASGENFNRHYANLTLAAADHLAPLVERGGTVTVPAVREALRAAAAALPAPTELASLRRELLGLAIDADLVLDLHCDNEAVLHLYTATWLWPDVEPLARLTGSRAVLLANESGEEPFDEACSTAWPRLAAELSRRAGRAIELPPACVSVTVELRGERDVEHGLATVDADAIVRYLVARGHVAGDAPVLPDLQCEPTPLAGSIPLVAPHGGVLVHCCRLGSDVRRGDRVAEIVDPSTGVVTALASPVDGVCYARESRRFVHSGTRVAKIAGREPLRSGNLLSD